MKLFKRKSNQDAPPVVEDKIAQEKPDMVMTSIEPRRIKPIEVDFSSDDPFYSYLLEVSGVVDIEKVNVDSPTLHSMKELGVRLVVPLVSQGELIGLLNLGPRLSEQDYSSDDKRLLSTLSTQASPALKVAQVARQQQAEALERERIEQELRVARVIQQTLLPKDLPEIPGWRLEALWKPAREVSGDFYDFVDLPDGRLAIFTGDVTDKGVPAALVMATTRTILRSVAEQLISPGRVLEKANNILCPDIPHNMFVTCLYMVLDPKNNKIVFANAGHNLPYKRTIDSVEEQRATGMPLGLLPGMQYDEKEFNLDPGESVLLYSDGLIEAHNVEREMFGFPRLLSIMCDYSGGPDLIDVMMDELGNFTGPDWIQEDDVTFVRLEHLDTASENSEINPLHVADVQSIVPEDQFSGELISEFAIPSEPGNERQAMELVANTAIAQGFPEARIEQLKTAVAEATMNGMEHGNHYDPEKSVAIKVLRQENNLIIWITDHGGGQPIPEHVKPDLDSKLMGLQSPRGWGLFLIENMVDEMRVHIDEHHHSLELVFHLPNDLTKEIIK